MVARSLKTLLLATLACGTIRMAAADAAAPHVQPAAHCAALIAQFDDVIIDRFDYRILMLEDYELAEALAWRTQAEAECGAGRPEFGIPLIASALERIGVVPEPPDPPSPKRREPRRSKKVSD